VRNFLLHRLRQIRRVGPLAAARLAWSRGIRLVSSGWCRNLARVRVTGLRTWSHETAPRQIVPRLVMPHDGSEIDWLAHRFDLLGSGPRDLNLQLGDVLVDLPPAWAGTAEKLRALLPVGYRLIDWQIDPKSGHRWSARTWCRAVVYGDRAGVDVKWPWELARLQHLPPLATRLAAAGAETRAALERELRAQVIDFVLQNPPGFGVNWVCAMDVGIRAANLALAVDLARAAGTAFDDRFLSLVSATLRDHGRHLVRNLEWGATLCSNHYLADVVGLLYVSAYLASDPETEDWLTFAGREVALQLQRQFNSDGSNFEASTSYHRLSAEMMLYGAAMMLDAVRQRRPGVEGWWSGTVRPFHPPPAAPALGVIWPASNARSPFGEQGSRRLMGMGRFTAALLREDGTIPQIGDDDSGRFVRLGYGRDTAADLISHAHLPAAVDALFVGPGESPGTGESTWLRGWMRTVALPRPSDQPAAERGYLAFPDFGLHVWRFGRFRLTFRCGPVGQNGNGGHAHSDQLGITLDVDGRPVLIDAGTGLYTPDPDVRNRFRAASAHGTLVVPGLEPNDWLPGRWGLFAMKDKSRARMIESGPEGAAAEHQGFGVVVRRRILVGRSNIEIHDEVPDTLTGVRAQAVLAHGIIVERDGSRYHLCLPDGRRLVTLVLPDVGVVVPVQVSPRYGRFDDASILSWAPGAVRLEFSEA